MTDEIEIDPTGKPIFSAASAMITDDKAPAPDELTGPGKGDGPGDDPGPSGGVLPEAPPPMDESQTDQTEESESWYKIELERMKQEISELKQAQQEKANRQQAQELTPQELRAQRLTQRQQARRRKIW